MRGLNKELRFLNQAVCFLGIVRLVALFVRGEVILREFAADEWIEELLGVVERFLECCLNAIRLWNRGGSRASSAAPGLRCASIHKP